MLFSGGATRSTWQSCCKGIGRRLRSRFLVVLLSQWLFYSFSSVVNQSGQIWSLLSQWLYYSSFFCLVNQSDRSWRSHVRWWRNEDDAFDWKHYFDFQVTWDPILPEVFFFIFQERPNNKEWHLIFQGVLELCSDTSSIASRVRSSIAGAKQLDISITILAEYNKKTLSRSAAMRPLNGGGLRRAPMPLFPSWHSHCLSRLWRCLCWCKSTGGIAPQTILADSLYL